MSYMEEWLEYCRYLEELDKIVEYHQLQLQFE